MNASQREALAKKCYENEQKGKTVASIAEDEKQDIRVVRELIKWWRENKVEQEQEISAARSKWRERTEQVWLYVIQAYESSELTLKEATTLADAYVKLAKLGIDLDALSKEKTLNLKVMNKTDAAIEELLGMMETAETAEEEEDAEL